MRTSFFGPSYVSRSPNAADNLLINLYPEIVESKQGKEVGSFYTTPGLDYLFSIGAGPISQLYAISPNASFGPSGLGDIVVGVSGNRFFYIDSSNQGHFLGGPMSMAPGAYCYTLATGALTKIALPFTPVGTTSGTWITSNGVQIGIFNGITADQQDGFVAINEPLTYRWWQSNILDLSTWDALNFASASGNPDSIVAVAQINREFFLLKQRHTEVWVNVGTAGFTFQRVDGVYIEAGLVAPKTVKVLGESLMWLGRNDQGENIVVQTRGYQPLRVSTHYIERSIAASGDATAASAYTYQQEGHSFYVLNVGDQTFVYDATASQQAGVAMWHQRDAIDSDGVSHRHWVDNTAVLNGGIIGGDYRNGNIYALNLDTPYDSDGMQTYPRRWLRSWRALPKPTDDPTRFSSLRLDMQTGIDVPQGLVGTSTSPDSPAPYCTLQWSDDGGHRWSGGKVASAGALGETARRVMFRRLGATRRGSGLDRLFQVSSGDCFPAALIGAELQ